ncbi:hypothetical protein [Giesbergeria anulus]|uniref:Uncharacterized protein n=1 Tax=Giesbergeria anulus TaxID=180197 RepID=A0A1H9K3G9_9BURK|nr:hypothetical protein [Giesbergeria anulus]SEQ93619.1 hypothetical protein SAMN02982919_01433 [Giesbergeria anulus]
MIERSAWQLDIDVQAAFVAKRMGLCVVRIAHELADPPEEQQAAAAA